jgi:hypothetical protein
MFDAIKSAFGGSEAPKRPVVRDTFPACACATCVELVRGQVVQSFAQRARRPGLDPERNYEVARDDYRVGFALSRGAARCAFCNEAVGTAPQSLMAHATGCQLGLTPAPAATPAPPKGAA